MIPVPSQASYKTGELVPEIPPKTSRYSQRDSQTVKARFLELLDSARNFCYQIIVIAVSLFPDFFTVSNVYSRFYSKYTVAIESTLDVPEF